MEKFWDSEANKFTLYGALFGMLFPLIATVLEALLQHGTLSWDALVSVQRNDPLLWIIDSAPFWLGIFARFAGRRQDYLKRLLRASGQHSDPRPEPPPTEDSSQFAGLLAYFGLALVAVVLFGLGIWIQSLILTRLPAAPSPDDNGQGAPTTLSNANTVAVAVATNTPIVLVAERATSAPVQALPAVVLAATPTPTATLAFLVSSAAETEQNPESLVAATPMPTTDPTMSRVRLGYLADHPYCAFFSQIAAIVWPQELKVAVDLQSFATSDELFTALLTADHPQHIDLTLCFLDPANRVYFREHQSAIQVLGKVFWKEGNEGLLTVANAQAAQLLKQAQPCLHNFIRNQSYTGLTSNDLEPVTWLAAHLDEVKGWASCRQS